MSTLFLLTLAAAALAIVAFVEVAHGEASHKHTNRLIHETSPYLLQHAHNPVDWYPWGPEAFEKARRENKPIFLSVGYSTCHWCHVMAHESFESEDVAEILNEHFVAIKVDREERPDVDEQYMMATQLFTRRGGWPNSVWLTPDGRPWFAGTYFPKEDRGGMAGFKTVLRELATAWRERRDDVEKQADAFADAIRQSGAAAGGGEPRPIDQQLVTRGIQYFLQNYDEDQGGFGSAPKFPPHGALAMMLHRQRIAPDLQLAGVIGHTLDAMAAGGIYDHLGGGFARYSTDHRWFLPHFEKMLYDNAQLVSAYSRAYELLGHAPGHYRDTVSHIYSWLEREMTDPAGGFYSALDADSEGEEGKFYVWTLKEIEEVLGEADAAVFATVYGATEDGNFVEEATRHRTGANVLALHQPISESAKQLGVDEAELRTRLEGMRAKLLERRATRIRPHLDDKVLSGWNGLMIGALAEAGRAFKDQRYTTAAAKAADFILAQMRADGRLLRSWREGEAKLPGYLDDYAYLVAGLLELHQTTKEQRWLDEARKLADQMIALFYDPAAGGFFNTSAEHEKLLLRAKELGGGGNVPSGNGVAAQVLTRLSLLTGETGYGEKAAATLRHFSGAMASNPHGNEALILAAAIYIEHAEQLPPLNPRKLRKSNADAVAAKPPVTIEAFAQHTTVAPGSAVQIALRLTIDEPYHIYGSKLAQQNLIPTSVTLSGGPATLGNVRYPESKQVVDPVLNEPIAMYDGQVTLLVPVTIAADAPAGPAPIVLTVRSQACDDRACLAPQTYTLSVPITIDASAPGAEPARHPEVFESLR